MCSRYFIPVGLLLLAGCAPHVPLHQDNPANPQPVTNAESPDVTLNLEHLGSQFNHLVFRVEVTNHTPDSVWFYPQKVSYYASPKMFTTPPLAADIHPASYANSQLVAKRIFASTPERILKIASNHATTMRVLSGVAILVSATVVVHDAVKDTKDYSKETWTNADANRAIARDAAVNSSILLADASLHASANATAEKYYLEEEILPIILLPPGGTVVGKVYLMKETSYRYTRVVVPFLNVEYVFDFKRKNAPGKSNREY